MTASDRTPQALSARIEQRRVAALSVLDGARQSRLGQFFTPGRAASLIAGFPRLPESGRLRVLDPGAGAGSLAGAVVARVLQDAPTLEVDVVAVEVDSGMVSYLAETLDDCVETAATAGTKVTTQLVVGDYLDLSTGLLSQEPLLTEPFDLVIMNPPYRKLALSSAYRKAMTAHGAECPNLYAAFLALGADALRPGGQLVAITPRSFANGPYFGNFRNFLLDRIALDRLHAFESRSTVFSDTGVLQENVIVSGTKSGVRDKVVLSVSTGHTDKGEERVVGYYEVVRPGDRQRFVRIASGGQDTAVAELIASMPATLADLGITVSTGKVVDFRCRDNLRETVSDGCVPLVYPGNLRNGIVEWPRAICKPQAFWSGTGDGPQKMLVPNGYYVAVKRFSAKEERRRIVAAIWDPDVNGEVDVAFENHLNVFHKDGAGLGRDLAVGLSLWLNSSVVDQFFRTFSGHTQVNATDLRSIRFPDVTALRALGSNRTALLPSQDHVDELVERYVMRAERPVPMPPTLGDEAVDVSAELAAARDEERW